MARTALALLLALAVLAPIWGENRALVVVVERYYNINNISSISLDVNNAVSILKLMGFKENQIKILRGSPTKSMIKSAFRSWLINGTSPGDTAAFYFSGHGGQIRDRNGDESDGLDEFLVPADFRVINGEYADPSTSFIDDELHDLIQSLSGRKVIILVDSCHSGTITREIKDLSAPTPKLVYTKDMEEGYSGGYRAIEVVEDVRGAEYLELSASQPNEVSWSYPGKGGVFSYYLLEGLRGSADFNGDGKITAGEIAKYVGKKSEQLASSSSDMRPQHPHVEGPLASRDLLSIAGGKPSTGPGITQLINEADQAVQQSSFKINISARRSYRVGEYISFNISSPKTGYYLYLFTIEPDGKITILFPNRKDRKFLLQKHSIVLPDEAPYNFRYRAARPAGRSYVYVFLRSKPFSYRQLRGIETGNFKVIESEADKAALMRDLRAIAIEEGGDYGAGKIVIEVRE